MKCEKIIDRELTQEEETNIDYLITYFGKTNMAFVGKHCAIVLNKNDKDDMVQNCLAYYLI